MAVDSTVNECGLWKMLRAAEDPGGDSPRTCGSPLMLKIKLKREDGDKKPCDDNLVAESIRPPVGLSRVVRARHRDRPVCRVEHLVLGRLGFNSTLEPDLLRWTNHRNRGAPPSRVACPHGAWRRPFGITIWRWSLAWDFGSVPLPRQMQIVVDSFEPCRAAISYGDCIPVALVTKPPGCLIKR